MSKKRENLKWTIYLQIQGLKHTTKNKMQCL